jgi:hypothetical protein
MSPCKFSTTNRTNLKQHYMNKEQCLARWVARYDSLPTPYRLRSSCQHPSNTPVPNNIIPENSLGLISPQAPYYLSSPIRTGALPESPTWTVDLAFDIVEGDPLPPNGYFYPDMALSPSQIQTSLQENPEPDNLADLVAELTYDRPDHSEGLSPTGSQSSALFESSPDEITFRDSSSISEQESDGAVEELHETAAQVVGTGRSDFECLLRYQTERGSIVFPFTTRSEYQLATWLNNTGLSRNDMASFFKLDAVSLQYTRWLMEILNFTPSSTSILLRLAPLKALEK